MSESIISYVSDINQFDFKDCPDDFKTAFHLHKNAWEDMLEVSDKYPSLRGEMHEIFDIIKEGEHGALFEKKLKAIWDTWSPIESFTK